MNENKKRKTIEIELNISSTTIKIIIICILIGMITGAKVITTVIQAEKWVKLETAEETSSAVAWVDSTEIDGEGNAKQVPIPKGYTASQIEGETTVSGGFVIYEGDIDWNKIIIEEETQTDDTTTELTAEEQTRQNIFGLQTTVNQWVWVPVEDISEIYGVDSNGKLWGKLYNFPTTATGKRSALNWTETNGIMNITKVTEYREASVLTNLSTYDIDSDLQSYSDGITRYELLTKEMEENFYATIKSIKEYGGFYIGRYETGGLSGKAVVQKLNTDIGKSWYIMYEKCKELKGTNNNVTTSMIWGALWCATLEWFVDSEATNSDGTTLNYYHIRRDSTIWGNYTNAEFEYITADGDLTTTEIKENTGGKIIPTGSADYTKVNNIYDMAGNVWDWTLSANGTRVYFGGNYGYQGSTTPAGAYYNMYPTLSASYIGCRAMLFIK